MEGLLKGLRRRLRAALGGFCGAVAQSDLCPFRLKRHRAASQFVNVFRCGHIRFPVSNVVVIRVGGRHRFALIGPPLIEKFLSNGSLVQPIDAPPVVWHAFHLLLPKISLPPAAVRGFAEWIKASFAKLAEGQNTKID